jgi:hypothetical protein
MIDEYGHRLVERGYQIIPLLKGKKRPPGTGWQNIVSTSELVTQWSAEMPEFGIGILASTTCAVDIDCLDKAVNNRLLHWLKNNNGLGPVRIGENPKCIAPFRNTEGFKKIRSTEFESADGVKHCVEILGDGQQWVAFGIHPKTLKPYEWISGPSIADIFHEDLPELTLETAKKFVAHFEDIARSEGWTEVKSGTREQAHKAEELMNFKASLDLSGEEIVQILEGLDADSDHDSWVKVGMALHHQFNGEAEGLELFETWSMGSEKFKDGECAKRWMSFGANKGASVTMASLKFEVAKAVSTDVIEECLPSMLANWAFVQVEGSARVLREDLNSEQIILYKHDDLKKEFANRRVLDHSSDKPRMMNLADLWLEHPERRTYAAGICFSPDSEVLQRYNLWRGWSYKAVQGDVTPFTQFVTDIVASGDADHANYILAWIAQMVQKPLSKVGVGLVLRGSKGSGKTFFGELVGGLCKAHHRIVSKADHITGKFNRHLEDTLLLQCDEAYWARNKAAEGALKDLLTNGRITVERKGMDSYTSNNYTRLLFSSNEEWVVPASLDERRFAIFDVSDERQQDAAYFGGLKRWYDRGGAEALLYFLKNFDLSTVDVRKAPQTAALDEQKLHSLGSCDQWLLDCINAGEFKDQRAHGDVLEFGKYELKSTFYQVYCSSVKGRYENAIKESMFWKHLKSIDGVIENDKRTRVGNRFMRYVQFASSEHALLAFNKHHKITHNAFADADALTVDPLDPANWADEEVPF